MRQEGILGNWALDTLTPKDLEDATDNLIKKATDQYDKVGSLKPEELNIENCVQVNIVGITRYQNAMITFKFLSLLVAKISLTFSIRPFLMSSVFL